MTWLNQPDIDKCVLVEIDYHDGEKRRTLYFASRPYMSKDTDTPASTPYDDLVISVPEIVATIDRGFSIGEVVLRNHEDMFDRWLNNAYQGWPIRVYIGQTDSPKSDFVRIVDGVCDGIRFPSLETVSFTFQDESEILDREVQTLSMPDGSPQPITLGECFNVTAKLEDANNLTYRVNDGECSIVRVRDNGVVVDFASNGDGSFNLLTAPAGAITADVIGYTDGTTSAIVQLLAARVGVANFDSFSFSAYPKTKLGIHIPDGGSVRQWITSILTSTGGYWYFDRTGRMSLGQLNFPTTIVDHVITPDELQYDGARITSITAPLQKIRMSFAKNYTPQPADSLAGSVSTQDRWLFSRENREVVIDSFVADQYPNAKSSDLIETYIVTEEEATTEAYRRATLLMSKAGNITISTVMQPTTVRLGDVVNFVYPKWGFQSGVLCRVVGFREFPLDNVTEIELWFAQGDCLCPTSNVVKVGATETARYRAISKNYRMAFDLGPVFRGDLSLGLNSRLWSIHTTLDGDITLAYQSAGNWQIDTVLFSRPATASLITNLNLTWDQLGRPFVTWEEAGEVYIWWYDSLEAATVVTKVADGRTPVCTLDERRPEYSANSDIVLFFINTDGGIEYRLQRDRFLVSYPTPVTEGGEAMGLDVLGPTNGRRLRLTFWDANEPLGRLRSLYTHPYPTSAENDSAQVDSSLVNIDFRDVVIEPEVEIESVGVDSEVIDISLRELVVSKEVDVDGAGVSSVFVDGDLRSVLIGESIEDDYIDVSSAFMSGSLEVILISKTVDTDSGNVSSSLVSASLTIP